MFSTTLRFNFLKRFQKTENTKFTVNVISLNLHIIQW